MNYKIVSDSSSNVLDFQGIDFKSVPLKIITAKHEYVDNAELDVEKMVNGDSWDLTLFTCTYDGRKRITVRAISVA